MWSGTLVCSKRNRESSCGGFLLIEVLIATTLMAVGVTATLNAIFNALKATKESQMYTQALFLAQEKMSEAETECVLNDDPTLPNGWQEFEGIPNFEWRVSLEDDPDFWTYRIGLSVRWAANERDLSYDDRTSYYRLVTEVPRPRYPEDYEK